MSHDSSARSPSRDWRERARRSPGPPSPLHRRPGRRVARRGRGRDRARRRRASACCRRHRRPSSRCPVPTPPAGMSSDHRVAGPGGGLRGGSGRACPASTPSVRARASPTRSAPPAVPRPTPTSIRSTWRRGCPTVTASSCPAGGRRRPRWSAPGPTGDGDPERTGQPQHRDRRAARDPPGVGPATAQAIISWRQQHGRFRAGAGPAAGARHRPRQAGVAPRSGHGVSEAAAIVLALSTAGRRARGRAGAVAGRAGRRSRSRSPGVRRSCSASAPRCWRRGARRGRGPASGPRRRALVGCGHARERPGRLRRRRPRRPACRSTGAVEAWARRRGGRAVAPSAGG